MGAQISKTGNILISPQHNPIFYTVMAKHIGTPPFLSDNAPLFPQKICNYKRLAILMFVSFLFFISMTQKSAETKSQR